MKRLTILAAAMLTLATAAHAQGTMGGLGFRSLSVGVASQLNNTNIDFSATPAIGIRQWLSEKVAVDLAVGFTSLSAEGGTPTVDLDEGTGFALDAGIPFALKKWDRVTFMVRPGFTYGSAEVKDKLDLTPPNEFTTTALSVSGELEVEWMLADRLSISAAHGIAYRSIKLEDNDTPADETKVTGFETTGDNFTSLGFHVYLW